MLDITTLSRMLMNRLPAFGNRKGLPGQACSSGKDWSDEQWLMAITAELGEVANEIRLYQRGSQAKEVYLANVNKELVDVVFFCLQMMMMLEGDPETIMIDKFNEVSDRAGSKLKLSSEARSDLEYPELNCFEEGCHHNIRDMRFGYTCINCGGWNC